LITNFNQLSDAIPDYAKDIKLNLSSLIANSEFDAKLVYGCAFASALSIGNESVITVFQNECQERFDSSFVDSIKSTVAIMTLNNVWYKYRDAMPSSEMKMAPQRMRVNVMANHAGLEKILFESISLCVSALNGCTFCVKAHSEILLKNDKTKEYIFNIGRIASVISATERAISF